MNSKIFRNALFLITFISLIVPAAGHVDQRFPDIIFYLSDDQDIYDYGCYGNEKIHTPAIDRLAKEGLMFHNAFTGQAICAPSRSQLYTGNYPLKNGCFLNHVKTKPEQLSITHYLSESGYKVILAGKSHVGPPEVYKWDSEWKPLIRNGFPRPYIPFDSIQNFFKNAEKPFCMFITSEYPHPPYFATSNEDTSDIQFYPFEADLKNDPNYIKRKAGYYRNVDEDNSQLETILNWVDEYLDDNTIFIYSSDHGMSGKFTVYDRGLNIPFIIRWPGVVKTNTESDIMIHFTDVLPTIMDIVGIETPEDMDGKSFLPVLRGCEKEIHEYIYGVQTNQNIQQCAVFPSRMIRSKQYKYIRNFNSLEVVEKNLGNNEAINRFIRLGAEKFKDTPYEELYDIKNDPFEQFNLANIKEYEAIKQELVDELLTWMKEQGDFLIEEGYMPLLKPSMWPLDKKSVHRKIPPELENTLTEDDYLILHY